MQDISSQVKIRSIQGVTNQVSKQSTQNAPHTQAFEQTLQAKINANSNIQFSKHALSRVMTREVDLSVDYIERLNHGAELARNKGLKSSLILIDKVAFVVNLHDNKVITAIQEEGLKNNVFTNIDGAVIV